MASQRSGSGPVFKTLRQNQEFSSKIRAESSGGHGLRASRSLKSFVFALRGREHFNSSLFFI